jgi:hypothetical protein
LSRNSSDILAEGDEDFGKMVGSIITKTMENNVEDVL